MSDSIREQIISAIITRMAIVRTAKGFNTDCGANVFRAASRIDPSQLDAISVFPRREEATDSPYGGQIATMPVDLNAVVAVPAVEAETEQERAERVSELIEQMLSDVIEAMEGSRFALVFTSGSRAPVAGETITGHTSGATGYVESVTLSSGSWSAGTAAGTIYYRRRSGSFTATETVDIGATLDVATAGATTEENAVTLATAGLADSVRYVEGGVDIYPEPADASAGVTARFEIAYAIKNGNPYSQPA